MNLRTYLPNTSDQLAICYLNDTDPHPKRAPMRITQIVGGKRWSISFIKFTKKKGN